MSRLRRLPIRVRVTLVFAGVMAVVLAGVGLFLYVRLGAELDAAIEQGLRSRAGDVSALVQQADSGLAESGRSPLTEQGENLAQILDSSGRMAAVLPDRDALALVDPARGAVAEIAVSASPWGVVVDGSRAFVSTPRLVAVVDVRRRRLVTRVPYRTRIRAVERGEYTRGGMGIATSADGRRVYVGGTPVAAGPR